MKRVGRCDAYATEFDLEVEEYVPLPKGDVHKKKAIVQARPPLRPPPSLASPRRTWRTTFGLPDHKFSNPS